MGTINPTLQRSGDGSVIVYEFLSMANGDDGAAIPFSSSPWADRSLQVLGTFGVGGSLRWEGSNDGGVTYAVLTDPQGNDLNITTAKIEQIMELTEFARPRVTGGDGTTSLNVYVLARRQQQLRV